MPLLEVFGVAALSVVAAVWLLGVTGEWWLLVPAMAIHLGMTVLVLWVGLRVASGAYDSPTPGAPTQKPPGR